MNAYGFAAGDPVNFSDPFGLCIEDACIAEGLIGGGALIEMAEPGLLHYVGSIVDVKATALAAAAIQEAYHAGTVVIGKVGQYNLGEFERTLHLPDQHSVEANWKQNAGRLREEIRDRGAIRDAHTDPRTGALLNDRKKDGSASFLTAERNLLRNKGYTYEPKNRLWLPPVK